MATALSRAASEQVGTAKPISVTTAERCVAFSRGVVFVTALAMLEGEALIGREPLRVLDVVVVVAGIYVVGTTVLSVLGRERPGLQLPLLVADMLMVTGVIYLAGGVASEYYLLYYIPILQASVRLNFRDAIASAILSSGLYATVGLSSGAETLIPVKAQLRAGTFAASATFMAAFFALLSREARSHLQRSQEMTELASALAAKNRELEEKSRQLAEAQQSLVAGERLAAIGELAASVGHELRNPLGVIRNAAYYLKTRLDTADPDVAEMVELMDAQVNVCDRTIAALLDFARPEQAVPEPLDLNALVEDVLHDCAPPSGIALHLALDPGAPLVRADPHQIGEVFSNIARNAYQAMGGEGELHVRTAFDSSAGQVSTEWTDTGPGIPPENLARIFDPLFTTKAKGIGLGLVVCKRLVERQGGDIAVHSEVGQGATFIVRLPQAATIEDPTDDAPCDSPDC
jgi:signal transduction histidine kinase